MLTSILKSSPSGKDWQNRALIGTRIRVNFWGRAGKGRDLPVAPL